MRKKLLVAAATTLFALGGLSAAYARSHDATAPTRQKVAPAVTLTAVSLDTTTTPGDTSADDQGDQNEQGDSNDRGDSESSSDQGDQNDQGDSTDQGDQGNSGDGGSGND